MFQEKHSKLLSAIISIGLLSFLGIVVETALNITFPQLTKYFSIPINQVQWLTTGYMLVSTSLIPLGSFFLKRFRVVTLFRVSCLSFLVGTLIASFSNSFNLVLLGRLCQGIADGIALPLIFAVILHQVPKKKVGTFMGIGSLVIALAPAVGPIYGGIIQDTLNWHFLFIILIPMIIVTWLLGELSIEQSSPIHYVPFDVRGGICLTIFLSTALMFIVNLTANSSSLKFNLILLGTVFFSGLLFLLNEKNKSHKLLELALFKNKRFLQLLSAFFLLQFSSLSMSYLIPNVLQILFDQSPGLVGFLVAPAAVIDAVLSVVAGIIYDKTTPSLPIISGCTIIGLTFLGANLFTPSIGGLVLIYMLFMVGLSFSYSNIMTYSLSKLPAGLVNDGNSIYMTVQAYSGAVGIAISSSVVSLLQKQQGSIISGTKLGLSINFLILFFVAVFTISLCLIALRNKVIKGDK
ncbi:MFS transporter [Lactobacillus iners]|uniref:MFS transporter n=1 Tax=Lactobacillus iners TaxID=147802 RepID=UPI0001E99865|nr:MFS transporter [Lactobacillus iners]EFQ47164.1 transporter, major facilitator family protein [Lactobacillus iners LEAF 2053A-b]EFQ50634.1 transporter, major facilitator family protein [Lactobacillus iners LEAF 2062A-h1]EFQ51905.1 transporter, major facilitator family protein [Lactobacillus iners LEAF 3008A-a]PMC41721.1 methyl viologen resistance protein SmvA [Lactobacillus iners]